jgi:hypothetical protein
MRGRHLAVVAGLLVLGAASAAAAAEQAASSAVQFVEDGPLRMAGGDHATVMVLNRHKDRSVKVTIHAVRLPASLVTIEPAQQTAPPNGTASFEVAATADEAGEGALVAVGDDGTVARLPLIVGLPLPPSLRFTGIDRVPLLSGGDRVEPIRVPGLASSTEAQTIGYVTGPHNTPAAVRRADDQLLVAGPLRSGAYRGTVDLTPGVGGGERPVELTVRDWFPYPLALLAAVVASIIALDRDGRRIGARYVLERHLDLLMTRAKQLQQEEQASVQQILPKEDRKGHRIARQRGRDPALLLDKEQELVVGRLYASDRSWADCLQDARESVDRISGHIELLSGIKRDIRAMHESYKALLARDGEQLRDNTKVAGMMDVLKDAEIETSAQLAVLTAKVAQARDDLEGELATSGPGPATPAPSHDSEPPDKLAAEAPLPDSLRGRGRWLPLAVGAALAVASGMVLLYGPDPTFGSTLDYLGVVIWGIATAGALLIARRFIPM